MRDWRGFQDYEQKEYQSDYSKTSSYFGHFSVPEFHVTNQIAMMLEKVEGPVLDIGCGILPMPNYLRLCKQPIGIDPYLGHRRKFPFCQAMGEWLPFSSGYFSGVLLMSSLDHTYRPEQVIKEAYRVLLENGLLFVWYINRHRPDVHHLWPFDSYWLHRQLVLAQFKIHETHTFTGDRQVGFPKTEMVVGRKI